MELYYARKHAEREARAASQSSEFEVYALSGCATVSAFGDTSALRNR
ncbi:MAG: hypothetical protein V7695_04750 [Sulfitobacter sp.]